MTSHNKPEPSSRKSLLAALAISALVFALVAAVAPARSLAAGSHLGAVVAQTGGNVGPTAGVGGTNGNNPTNGGGGSGQTNSGANDNTTSPGENVNTTNQTGSTSGGNVQGVNTGGGGDNTLGAWIWGIIVLAAIVIAGVIAFALRGRTLNRGSAIAENVQGQVRRDDTKER